MEAIFPAPKACTGPARRTRTVRVRRRVEVFEKAMVIINYPRIMRCGGLVGLERMVKV